MGWEATKAPTPAKIRLAQMGSSLALDGLDGMNHTGTGKPCTGTVAVDMDGLHRPKPLDDHGVLFFYPPVPYSPSSIELSRAHV
jgi:hypothetical protein